MHKLPDSIYLETVLEYRDGPLFGRVRPREHFVSERAWKIWNAKFSGKRLGRQMAGSNYRQLMVDGVRFLEHRLVAALHGMSTEQTIDHIDGDGSNNRIENLRAASLQENTRNHGGARGKAERVGVHRRSDSGKWVAYVSGDDGQRLHLGTFGAEKDAAAARVSAEQAMYGRFAPSLSRYAEPQ